MEKLRADKLNACATMIQKNIRRYLTRLHYLRTRKAILMLQSVARQKYAVCKLELMRKEKAAVVIQKNWRRYIARKKYLQTRQTIIQTQAGNITFTSLLKEE